LFESIEINLRSLVECCCFIWCYVD